METNAQIQEIYEKSPHNAGLELAGGWEGEVGGEPIEDESCIRWSGMQTLRQGAQERDRLDLRIALCEFI